MVIPESWMYGFVLLKRTFRHFKTSSTIRLHGTRHATKETNNDND